MQNFDPVKLNRPSKIVLQLLCDVSLLTVSFVATMLFKHEDLSFAEQPTIWGAFFVSALTSILTLWYLEIYLAVVRFVTGKILISVAKTALLSATSLYIADMFFNSNISRFVPVLFAVFVFFSLGGIRFAARTYFRRGSQLLKKPVIVYGAGEAGIQLVNALFHGTEFTPIALVDDELSLRGMNIGGLDVYSPDQIPTVVNETGAKVVLLAMPTVRRGRRQEIVNSLTKLQLEIKTIPKMSDLISGKAKISELRTVSVEDLLGREPVAAIPELLSENITGQVVMVTGAGGSIGSELCRQVLNQAPLVLVLYELSELALYTIEDELRKIRTTLQYETRIVPILGSVQNRSLVEAVIGAYKANTIYHAAAYKHVPLVEENIAEGIRNNVHGTLTISEAAQKHGVKNFILISTDKAVRPTNVMGATKRIAELICQAHANDQASTIFSIVRFGNVLGSSGSVIPRFQAQIEAGGPVTVTHKDITRYFMTIPEAAQLVLQAGALGNGGDVFLLDMGKPVKIIELALSMVKLHGIAPYVIDHIDQISPDKGDIPICVTGLRKGEKLYEELLIGNNPQPTRHPRIMAATEVSIPSAALMEMLDRLLYACSTFDLSEIIAILHELPLDYAPQSTGTSDLLWNKKQDIEQSQDSSTEVGLRT
ncbi:polysaccharide biosynthesis protein [Nereida ignava]|uniref:polysaccharide biosynthesis protein n=1 Tax=Nereida ignava TaxID=282199 RepID=UPI002FE267A5